MLLDRRNIVVDFVAMLVVPAETANIAASVSAVPFGVQFLLQPFLFGARLVFHRIAANPEIISPFVEERKVFRAGLGSEGGRSKGEQQTSGNQGFHRLLLYGG